MFEVDRIAAVIKPKQPMCDWLNEHPCRYENISLSDLRKDCITLLIPAFAGPNQSLEYIKQISAGIFEAELISWGVPKGSWPKDMNPDVFLEWFDIEFHSILYDVAFLEEKQRDKLSTVIEPFEEI